MTYNSVSEMAASGSLTNRVAACAAKEGIENPTGWAGSHMWQLASSLNWDAQWDYAKATATVNTNPDIGARDDVISDADILAAVQNIVATP